MDEYLDGQVAKLALLVSTEYKCSPAGRFVVRCLAGNVDPVLALRAGAAIAATFGWRGTSEVLRLKARSPGKFECLSVHGVPVHRLPTVVIRSTRHLANLPEAEL